MKYSSKTLEFEGKQLTLEIGLVAPQATSSVMARLGETVVLVTVVLGKENPNLDYFPLSVDYIERLYAGGKIKGSKWVKREGRPSDDAILAARLIDRSIRPLFPKEFKREVQVVATMLSVDGENDPDVLALVAASTALSVSKIPWNGPIGAVRMGIIKGENEQQEIVVNPSISEYEFLDLEMVVSGNKEKVVMIEAAAKEIPEDMVLKAIKKAKEANGKIIEFINKFIKEVGEPKVSFEKDQAVEDATVLVQKSFKGDIEELIRAGVGKEVGDDLNNLIDKIFELEKENVSDRAVVAKAVDKVFKKTIREMILKEGKRPDGRKIDEIREISSKVGILPRTHGSALFQRGETQVLTIATLGSPSLEQLIESPEGEEAKRYMHHYSMPPYSVGEVGRVGFLSRREIGHGALAERALEPVVPSASTFPYAIRLVSEVMSSNGSTSMASTCGSTLALMDAGVPISAPVSGIAMGLMTGTTKDGKTDTDNYMVLSDIMGLEDFSGDMDFKVAGTEKGVTAVQMDVKIDGLTDTIIEETVRRAYEGRMYILGKMIEVIAEARKDVSQFAPKIKQIRVSAEKIGEVIGSGGKVIRNIIASTGANVDINDEGVVTISSTSDEAVEKAEAWIDLLTRDIQKGEVFEGKVRRILPFGAMVEIVPGKEGLVHVSEMSTEYVNNPADVVSIGQEVKVRVKEIDEQGRTNLSMLFGEDAEKKKEGQRGDRREDSRDRRPRENYRGQSSAGSRNPRFDRGRRDEKRRY
jgi:polyribonucleotide nucleotidyltransferase